MLIIEKIWFNISKASYCEPYTKFLDFSYFEHPAITAPLIKASLLIFGNDKLAAIIISSTFFIRSIGIQVRYILNLLFLLFTAMTFLCIKEVYYKKDRTALIIAYSPLLAIFILNELTIPYLLGYLILSIYIAHLILKFWHIKWFRIYFYTTWAIILLIMIIIIAPMHNEMRRIATTYPPSNQRSFIFHKNSPARKLKPSATGLRMFCINGNKIIDTYDFRQGNLKNKDSLFTCNDLFLKNHREEPGCKVSSTSYIDIERFPVYKKAWGIKKKFLKSCKLFNKLKMSGKDTSKDLFQEFIRFDYNVFSFINSNLKCKFLDFYMAPISYCDSINFNVSFFAILIISILILWKNKKNHFWNNLVLLSIILAIVAVVIYFLKHCFERPRPLSIFSDKNINLLFEKAYSNSFPSGHTEIIVAICTFMFITVRKYWYWYIIIASMTGFYRIYSGTHFPSDVLAGAMLGIIFAYIIIILFKKYYRTYY
jgi:undecaprenyl-diphosphatase